MSFIAEKVQSSTAYKFHVCASTLAVSMEILQEQAGNLVSSKNHLNSPTDWKRENLNMVSLLALHTHWTKLILIF